MLFSSSGNCRLSTKPKLCIHGDAPWLFSQVKVMTELDLLPVACEQFLGKSVMEIKAVVLQTLEGHLRSILGLKLYMGLSSGSHPPVFLMPACTVLSRLCLQAR